MEAPKALKENYYQLICEFKEFVMVLMRGMLQSDMKAIVLMDLVVDKLNLLDYDSQFCRTRLPPWPGLHKFYFAFPSNNHDEQFRYFTSLVVWLFKLIGHELSTPSKLEDPNATCADILLQLREIGFSTPSWPSKKLEQGYGDAVCSVLDGLATLALETQKFEFHMPNYDNDIALRSTLNEVKDIDDSFGDELYLPKREEQETSNTKDELDEVVTKSKATSVVDPKQWQLELERVAPQLRASVVADGNDWRARLEHALQLHGEMSQTLEANNEQLQRVDLQISDYSATKDRLTEVQQKQNKSLENVAALKDGISATANQLDKVKKLMLEKGNMISDVSPLLQIKQAISNLKEELREMEVRIGTLQHTLLQVGLKKAQIQGHAMCFQQICLSS
ncbi:hypothetical protein O6H91_05G023300 [Diphasiastrum complanatum]|uniref:Uncharacterized protein n=1 Tax=Diphasiastrum complanatum TaxID=34168 RepID=A0ACC2DM09_DIPCM|nr:hypothetical protein O6H91_05G023300 [Diphasiastrum complanatum]